VSGKPIIWVHENDEPFVFFPYFISYSSAESNKAYIYIYISFTYINIFLLLLLIFLGIEAP
jgi:hypothetical protein